ncbi:sulfotransferase family protein [Mycolicibacterium duvalii]|uniref:Putative sulfotransferase n=1 Tax=Mycolicibacterium duvalii TaxID=39688 RepID=A0A7I7JZ48_9MYCO|nr:sulfotransferase [Mycolicibacterium duvalii]MCV7370902.1 sulfotransferase [Mycolicibacterium duvalii]PEG41383.1 sulfotransferase family protein [Mycolicibacterium duvalii]BBX17156.1 putative sulfotransferase [Mycolicibacterium duvalii]
MSAADRLVPDRLVEQACDQAGSDDFGSDDSWRDGLERLTHDFVKEARLSDLGVEIAAADVLRALTNRLEITQWRVAHPEVAEQQITQPIVIVGQPRTGTTILYDLLAQDPQLRPPLTWEVDRPFPVPDVRTYHTDPRIAETQASIDLAEQLMPGFQAFHPMGALVGQECVRITAGQFCSMIFSVQYRLPNYYQWLLHEADHRDAYRYHRKFLQHLQSGVPGQWLLKSPAHLWQLDVLLQEYPDALIVQTHRDPLNVISSVSALTVHLRRMASERADIQEAAVQCREEIVVGLEREMRFRDSGVLAPDRVVDVHFADFMRDPFATIGNIYRSLGRELPESTEQRMRDYLAAHPGDGSVSRYTWADTGLDAATVRDQVAEYQQRYGVPTETLK